MNKNHNKLSICLIGSKEYYPAFESVSSILREILGQNQVTELRITGKIHNIPSFLKIVILLMRDFLLCLKLLRTYKKEKINIFLIFQGLYPLTSMGVKLTNAKLVDYIGGSPYIWSYLENTSIWGKIISFSNIILQEICYKLADLLITLSPSMVEMIPIKKHMNKTLFALPRIDRQFYVDFKPIIEYK
ncbi:MAG: hypothetical protein QXZ17_10130, partial [Nitrososphaerota archaeon]